MPAKMPVGTKRWSGYLWGHTRTTAATLQQSFKVNPAFLLPPWKWILDLTPEQAENTALPAFNNLEKIEIASFGGPTGKSTVMVATPFANREDHR